MKKPINSGVLETTLEFIDAKISIYNKFYEAAKSEKLKKEYQALIDDSNALKECIIESFSPKRGGRSKREL